ncbi:MULTISPECIES: hypothetical protein [unclassified Microcoleus]|uniref:hypothetical protein n=1 Tax=unclassified Microcoleus TaxID=2642155 RepID=UPI002FCF3647
MKFDRKSAIVNGHSPIRGMVEIEQAQLSGEQGEREHQRDREQIQLYKQKEEEQKDRDRDKMIKSAIANLRISSFLSELRSAAAKSFQQPIPNQGYTH